MHLSRYVPYWSRRQPNQTVLVCEDEQMSWAELERRSGSLAAYLEGIGLQRGDRLGLLLENSLEWCVGFVASMRLGTIAVPLNHNFGRFELDRIDRDATCAAILSCPAQMAKIGVASEGHDPEQRRLYRRQDDVGSIAYSDILAADAPFLDRSLPESDALAICYTSGTTGLPKGAILTHAAVQTMSLSMSATTGLRQAEERFLILAPLSFAGGAICCLAPQLMLGGTGYLEKRVDPARVLKLLTEHRITIFSGVPALWERIAAAPGFAEADLSALRSAATGGAPVPRVLMDTFLAKGVTILQQYGMTEACGGVTSADHASARLRPWACGTTVLGTEIELRNDQGDLVAPGEIGEIRVRGPQVTTSFWNKPELTTELFDGSWYKSGDLGMFDEHGGLVVVDRKKNMLISGGVNIYPAEIERAMAEIPRIVEMVVLGIPSTRWGQEVAAIVYAPGVVDTADIRAQARDLLGSYKAPKHIVLSPKPLPRTVSNKIVRTGLLELYEALSQLAHA